MRFRCHYPSHPAYLRYSSAGITVCDQWRYEYEPFMRWAMSAGYQDDLEIDRSDNCAGYSPENCRWVTRSVNARNKSSNLAAITAFGEAKTPLDWTADSRCVVSYRLLLKRLEAGWEAEVALAVASQARRGPRPVGRQRRGECKPNAKLTPDAVRTIRVSALSESVLGTQYGISAALVGLVRRRKVWKHVA